MATESGTPETERKKPTLAGALVPVAIILAICLFVIGYLGERKRGQPQTEAGGAIVRKVGEVLPDLELKSLDGKSVRLSELKAKVIVLNFWATWCPPCVKEMPALEKLSETYGPKGLAVVGVSLDENPAEVLNAFLKKNGIHFPSYVDPDGKLADRFSVSGLPLTLVMDGNRKLLLEQVGDEDWMSPDYQKQFEIWLAQAGAK
ncbi:MAG: TlpA family protein disulfide reductase [Cryobacterium sp.]|nr:TlpA family protein disulfide reductase [Oligoflexia bacterium]